jgi:hypothetical protein
MGTHYCESCAQSRAERAPGAAATKNKGKFSILIKHENNNIIIINKSNSRFSTRRSAADYFRMQARTPVRTLTVWSEFGQAREERDGVY